MVVQTRFRPAADGTHDSLCFETFAPSCLRFIMFRKWDEAERDSCNSLHRRQIKEPRMISTSQEPGAATIHQHHRRMAGAKMVQDSMPATNPSQIIWSLDSSLKTREQYTEHRLSMSIHSSHNPVATPLGFLSCFKCSFEKVWFWFHVQGLIL